MAEKRMFSNKVIGSDSFLEMPDSTQNLYFHLSMYADDDGFVDKPKSIMRMTGKKEDDLKILIAKSFLIPFDTGVVVIKHWRLNNYLRKDRYQETQYTQEKSTLKIAQSGEYEVGIPMVSIDKNRVDKNSIDILDKSNIVTPSNDGVPVINEIIIELPLRDRTLYSIDNQLIKELTPIYSKVDICEQLKQMKGWLIGNPAKQKTRKGIKRFITGWLSREQTRILNSQTQPEKNIEKIKAPDFYR